jgi:hypothetical protein
MPMLIVRLIGPSEPRGVRRMPATAFRSESANGSASLADRPRKTTRNSSPP